MNKDQHNNTALQHIMSILESLLKDNAFPTESAAFSYPPEWMPVYERCLELFNDYTELKHYILALAEGNIDIDAPPRKNYLAGSLKHFQAQLRHLIWQAECIARGDFKQKLDFMGALSDVFNKMSIQLQTRETQLKAQQEAMSRIFDRLDPIFIIANNDTREILYANHMAQARFQITNNICALDHAPSIFQQIFQLPQDGTPTELATPFVAADSSETSASSETSVTFDSPATSDSAAQPDTVLQSWYRITCAPFPWSGYEDSLLFHCVDITMQKRHADMLERAANTDKMTGLKNRSHFEVSSHNLWEACYKTSSMLSILMFDIDDFKRCNDTYGHLHGDTCLRTFSNILSLVFSRSSDLVARYGGEEFIVALPFTPINTAIQMAERARRHLEQTPIPIALSDHAVTSITVSGGVASLIPHARHTLETLITTADQALYKAKQEGKNCIVSTDLT